MIISNIADMLLFKGKTEHIFTDGILVKQKNLEKYQTAGLGVCIFLCVRMCVCATVGPTGSAGNPGAPGNKGEPGDSGAPGKVVG